MKKKLTPDIKNQLYQDIQEGKPSISIQEKYGLTASQLNYYKKLNNKWISTIEEIPKESSTKGKKISFVDDLVNSINVLKKEKQAEKEENVNETPGNNKIDASFPLSNNLIEANNLKKARQRINLNDYVQFTIDGIEVLVRKNTKRIVIEQDNVSITR